MMSCRPTCLISQIVLKMATQPYPPWDSAPGTLERNKQSHTPSSPKWLNNAKEAILRPWRQRSQRRQKKKAAKQAADTPYRQDEYMYNQNPFAPRPFAAGGGFPRFNTPFSPDIPSNHPATGGGPRTPRNGFADHASSPEPDLPRGHFEPEVALLYKPSRPALSNVFTMYDSPQLTPAPQRPDHSMAGIRPTPERKIAEMIHSPERNLAGMRRHSTPGGPPIPKPEPRRPSRTSVSSDISSERSNRRERRANMMRVIPILPNKPRVEKENVYSHTPSRIEQYPSTHVSPVYPRQHSDYTQPPHVPYSPNHPLQGQGLSNSFSFPPWPQPREQLRELVEELEEDEIEGGEGTSIEEDVRLGLRTGNLSPNTYKKLQEEESDGNIRGFDTFMMY